MHSREVPPGSLHAERDERHKSDVAAQQLQSLSSVRAQELLRCPTDTRAKTETQKARPCGVIAPERAQRQSPGHNAQLGLREPWLASEPSYNYAGQHNPPSDYVYPQRNISPRQTFQENMKRILVPPRCDLSKIIPEPTLPVMGYPYQSNKNVKVNLNTETKYCQVPYLANQIPKQQRTSVVRSNEVYAPSGGTSLHGRTWPVPAAPVAAQGHYFPPEYYGYQQSYAAHPGRPAKLPHKKTAEEIQPTYNESLYRGNDIRFDPYSTAKDKQSRLRYPDYMNYPNPYHAQKCDQAKQVSSPAYVNYTPQKYVDPRIAEPRIAESISEAYPRPTQYVSGYSTAHPDYLSAKYVQPSPMYSLPGKMYGYPEGGIRSTQSLVKSQYDVGKSYCDNDYSHKVSQLSDSPQLSDVSTYNFRRQFPMNNYTMNNSGQPRVVNYLYPHQTDIYRGFPESYPPYKYPNPQNPLAHIPAKFSPNIISPSESSTSIESMNMHSAMQDDCGYVSQCSTVSNKSFDYSHYKMHQFDNGFNDSRIFNMKPTYPLQKLDKNFTHPKDTKNIDVRQFIQNWDENDDDECIKTKENVAYPVLNHVQTANSENPPTSEQPLYVLGYVNIPNEEIGKYEHIQKVCKLPENIRGYDSADLLNKFDEAFRPNVGNNSLEKKTESESTNTNIAAIVRSPSPFDIEAKITQSVIHKDVGCNFEIKPFSPPTQNSDSSAGVQNVNETNIDKMLNHDASFQSNNEHDMKNNLKCPVKRKSDDDDQSIIDMKLVKSVVPECRLDEGDQSEINKNYNSLTGVCLASLPRLDNEIEINFPEINEQYCGLKRDQETVIISTPNSSLIEHDNRTNTNDVEKSHFELGQDHKVKEVSPYEFSHTLSITSNKVTNENVPMKLTKFRKSKSILPSENNCDYSNGNENCLKPNQSQRTNSVIIKNPDSSEYMYSELENPIRMEYSPKCSSLESNNFNKESESNDPSTISIDNFKETDNDEYRLFSLTDSKSPINLIMHSHTEDYTNCIRPSLIHSVDENQESRKKNNYLGDSYKTRGLNGFENVSINVAMNLSVNPDNTNEFESTKDIKNCSHISDIMHSNEMLKTDITSSNVTSVIENNNELSNSKIIEEQYASNDCNNGSSKTFCEHSLDLKIKDVYLSEENTKDNEIKKENILILNDNQNEHINDLIDNSNMDNSEMNSNSVLTDKFNTLDTITEHNKIIKGTDIENDSIEENIENIALHIIATGNLNENENRNNTFINDEQNWTPKQNKSYFNVENNDSHSNVSKSEIVDPLIKEKKYWEQQYQLQHEPKTVQVEEQTNKKVPKELDILIETPSCLQAKSLCEREQEKDEKKMFQVDSSDTDNLSSTKTDFIVQRCLNIVDDNLQKNVIKTNKNFEFIQNESYVSRKVETSKIALFQKQKYNTCDCDDIVEMSVSSALNQVKLPTETLKNSYNHDHPNDADDKIIDVDNERVTQHLSDSQKVNTEAPQVKCEIVRPENIENCSENKLLNMSEKIEENRIECKLQKNYLSDNTFECCTNKEFSKDGNSMETVNQLNICKADDCTNDNVFFQYSERPFIVEDKFGFEENELMEEKAENKSFTNDNENVCFTDIYKGGIEINPENSNLQILNFNVVKVSSNSDNTGEFKKKIAKAKTIKVKENSPSKKSRLITNKIGHLKKNKNKQKSLRISNLYVQKSTNSQMLQTKSSLKSGHTASYTPNKSEFYSSGYTQENSSEIVNEISVFSLSCNTNNNSQISTAVDDFASSSNHIERKIDLQTLPTSDVTLLRKTNKHEINSDKDNTDKLSRKHLVSLSDVTRIPVSKHEIENFNTDNECNVNVSKPPENTIDGNSNDKIDLKLKFQHKQQLSKHKKISNKVKNRTGTNGKIRKNHFLSPHKIVASRYNQQTVSNTFIDETTCKLQNKSLQENSIMQNKATEKVTSLHKNNVCSDSGVNVSISSINAKKSETTPKSETESNINFSLQKSSNHFIMLSEHNNEVSPEKKLPPFTSHHTFDQKYKYDETKSSHSEKFESPGIQNNNYKEEKKYYLSECSSEYETLASSNITDETDINSHKFRHDCLSESLRHYVLKRKQLGKKEFDDSETLSKSDLLTSKEDVNDVEIKTNIELQPMPQKLESSEKFRTGKTSETQATEIYELAVSSKIKESTSSFTIDSLKSDNEIGFEDKMQSVGSSDTKNTENKKEYEDKTSSKMIEQSVYTNSDNVQTDQAEVTKELCVNILSETNSYENYQDTTSPESNFFEQSIAKPNSIEARIIDKLHSESSNDKKVFVKNLDATSLKTNIVDHSIIAKSVIFKSKMSENLKAETSREGYLDKTSPESSNFKFIFECDNLKAKETEKMHIENLSKAESNVHFDDEILSESKIIEESIKSKSDSFENCQNNTSSQLKILPESIINKSNSLESSENYQDEISLESKTIEQSTMSKSNSLESIEAERDENYLDLTPLESKSIDVETIENLHMETSSVTIQGDAFVEQSIIFDDINYEIEVAKKHNINNSSEIKCCENYQVEKSSISQNIEESIVIKSDGLETEVAENLHVETSIEQYREMTSSNRKKLQSIITKSSLNSNYLDEEIIENVELNISSNVDDEMLAKPIIFEQEPIMAQSNILKNETSGDFPQNNSSGTETNDNFHVEVSTITDKLPKTPELKNSEFEFISADQLNIEFSNEEKLESLSECHVFAPSYTINSNNYKVELNKNCKGVILSKTECEKHEISPDVNYIEMVDQCDDEIVLLSSHIDRTTDYDITLKKNKELCNTISKNIRINEKHTCVSYCANNMTESETNNHLSTGIQDSTCSTNCEKIQRNREIKESNVSSARINHEMDTKNISSNNSEKDFKAEIKNHECESDKLTEVTRSINHNENSELQIDQSNETDIGSRRSHILKDLIPEQDISVRKSENTSPFKSKIIESSCLAFELELNDVTCSSSLESDLLLEQPLVDISYPSSSGILGKVEIIDDHINSSVVFSKDEHSRCNKVVMKYNKNESDIKKASKILIDSKNKKSDITGKDFVEACEYNKYKEGIICDRNSDCSENENFIKSRMSLIRNNNRNYRWDKNLFYKNSNVFSRSPMKKSLINKNYHEVKDASEKQVTSKNNEDKFDSKLNSDLTSDLAFVFENLSKKRRNSNDSKFCVLDDSHKGFTTISNVSMQHLNTECADSIKHNLKLDNATINKVGKLFLDDKEMEIATNRDKKTKNKFCFRNIDSDSYASQWKNIDYNYSNAVNNKTCNENQDLNKTFFKSNDSLPNENSILSDLSASVKSTKDEINFNVNSELSNTTLRTDIFADEICENSVLAKNNFEKSASHNLLEVSVQSSNNSSLVLYDELWTEKEILIESNNVKEFVADHDNYNIEKLNLNNENGLQYSVNELQNTITVNQTNVFVCADNDSNETKAEIQCDVIVNDEQNISEANISSENLIFSKDKAGTIGGSQNTESVSLISTSITKCYENRLTGIEVLQSNIFTPTECAECMEPDSTQECNENENNILKLVSRSIKPSIACKIIEANGISDNIISENKGDKLSDTLICYGYKNSAELLEECDSSQPSNSENNKDKDIFSDAEVFSDTESISYMHESTEIKDEHPKLCAESSNSNMLDVNNAFVPENYTCNEINQSMFSINTNSSMCIGELQSSPNVVDICENGINFECKDIWIDDIACVETVVSEEIIENDDDDDILGGASFEKVDELESHNEINKQLSYDFDSTKIKNIYGDNMNKNDIDLIESLYRNPHMLLHNRLLNCQKNTEQKDKNICVGLETNPSKEVKTATLLQPLQYHLSSRALKKGGEKIKTKILETSQKDKLITKAAQKYVPPLNAASHNFKVKLVLPEEMLAKLKNLKSKSEHERSPIPKLKINTLSIFNSNVYTKKKKIKPNFEDVLKNIDDAHYTKKLKHKKNPFKGVPKVIIKKNTNGSHYTSKAVNSSYNPDLTGSKWQPCVYLERLQIIEKMLAKRKTNALFCSISRQFVIHETRYENSSRKPKPRTRHLHSIESVNKNSLRCTLTP